MSQVSTPWHLRAIGLVRHNHQGATGKGVTIAVIDTGIDTTHPDLTGKVLSAYSIDIQGQMVREHLALHRDFHGHGTSVASLICSDHLEIGVAPDARLISMRYDRHRGNNYARLRHALTGLIQGVAAGTFDIDLVNLSSGLNITNSKQRQVLQDLIKKLIEVQILPITAVGNNCPPSGTSFATPICTGVAAMVLEGMDEMEADDLREVLLGICLPLPDPRERQGAGLVQIP